MVEVRGVEPRSAKPSALASPSAVVSELSANRNSDDEFPCAYSELVLTPRSRNPVKSIPRSDVRPRPCGSRPGGRATYLGSQCEVIFGTYWCFRFVNGAPETPARFQRIIAQRRNRFTPMRDVSITLPPTRDKNNASSYDGSCLLLAPFHARAHDPADSAACRRCSCPSPVPTPPWLSRP